MSSAILLEGCMMSIWLTIHQAEHHQMGLIAVIAIAAVGPIYLIQAVFKVAPIRIGIVQQLAV